MRKIIVLFVVFCNIFGGNNLDNNVNNKQEVIDKANEYFSDVCDIARMNRNMNVFLSSETPTDNEKGYKSRKYKG